LATANMAPPQQESRHKGAHSSCSISFRVSLRWVRGNEYALPRRKTVSDMLEVPTRWTLALIPPLKLLMGFTGRLDTSRRS
jgi:hypothetical protein